MIEPSDAFEARASLVAELRAHAERKTPLRRLLIRAANVIELLNLLSPAISKTDPRTHKWFDPECGEDGCQALVLRRRYESAVRGRRDFRQAYRSALLDLRSRPASALSVVGEPTHRHVKTGGEYTLLGFGRMQAGKWKTPTIRPDEDGRNKWTHVSIDMREVAIYRGADGKLWVRPREEFEDGRFVALIPSVQP